MYLYVWVVLVKLFNVWVSSFYNGGYLSGEDFGVLTLSCEIDGKYNFYSVIWS